MILVDTHTHLYLEHFDDDRSEMINRAIDRGVKYMLIPNIDSKSVDGMMQLCNDFPKNCFPMMIKLLVHILLIFELILSSQI